MDGEAIEFEGDDDEEVVSSELSTLEPVSSTDEIIEDDTAAMLIVADSRLDAEINRMLGIADMDTDLSKFGVEIKLGTAKA